MLALLFTAVTVGPAIAGDERGPDRPVPDYDGRGEEPTDAGDVLLWVPRILVSPLYLTTEFLLRRPLGFVISEAEEGLTGRGSVKGRTIEGELVAKSTASAASGWSSRSWASSRRL